MCVNVCNARTLCMQMLRYRYDHLSVFSSSITHVPDVLPQPSLRGTVGVFSFSLYKNLKQMTLTVQGLAGTPENDNIWRDAGAARAMAGLALALLGLDQGDVVPLQHDSPQHLHNQLQPPRY